MRYSIVTAALAVITLVGCGGGGGKSSAPANEPPIAAGRTATGPPELDSTAPHRVDTAFVTSGRLFGSEYPRAGYHVDALCADAKCILSVPQLGYTHTFDFTGEDVDRSFSKNAGVQYRRITTTEEDTTTTLDAIGENMDYVEYAVGSLAGRRSDGARLRLRFAYANGSSTGSAAPLGTWRGHLAGTAGWAPIVGDTKLTVKSDGLLDAEFNNVQWHPSGQVGEGGYRPIVPSFSNVRVRGDGTFRWSQGPGDGSDLAIQGSFFGPGHAEAAGTLNAPEGFYNGVQVHYGVIGAFGAKRQ